MRKVIIGGIIGAVIAFIWQFISWGVLHWHDRAINQFKNQDFVSWVIKENAPLDGVYLVPFYKADGGNLTPEEIKHNRETQQEAMSKGPLVYAQVRLQGINPTSPHLYIISFLTQFAGAVLISVLLLRMIDSTYGERLVAVTMIGLIVGILAHLPSWNWFGAGLKYTIIMIIDLTITWFLAGLFLAAYVKHTEMPEQELPM